LGRLNQRLGGTTGPFTKTPARILAPATARIGISITDTASFLPDFQPPFAAGKFANTKTRGSSRNQSGGAPGVWVKVWVMKSQTSPLVTTVPPAFLNRFGTSITGVLSGFDRLRLRGTLRHHEAPGQRVEQNPGGLKQRRALPPRGAGRASPSGAQPLE
jgi:hypothetical protein